MAKLEKSVTEVMDLVKTDLDTETYVKLEKIVSKDIAVLGTDEVFTLRDSRGEIKAFRSLLTLSAENGGLIQPGYKKPWVISAQGYEMWQEAVGATVVFPKTVVVDGGVIGNPHTEKDSKNNIVSVTARARAYRFSDKGIPQVQDWTTVFDLDQYRMIDLLAKAKKFPQAFKLLPRSMDINDVDVDPDGTWTPYYFDEATKLWVNTTHGEAYGWYTSIRNRAKKAVDYAQTFAKRNALKHLSGLQKAPGPKWEIPVLCWRPTGNNIIQWDGRKYAEMQDRIDGIIDDGGVEFGTGTETAISDDEDHEIVEAEIDPEDQENGQVSPPEPAPASTKPAPAKSPDEPVRKATQSPIKAASPGTLDPSDPMVILKNNLLGVYENFPDEFTAVCRDMNIDPEDIKTIAPEGISEKLAKTVLKRVSNLVDKANA